MKEKLYPPLLYFPYFETAIEGIDDNIDVSSPKYTTVPFKKVRSYQEFYYPPHSCWYTRVVRSRFLYNAVEVNNPFYGFLFEPKDQVLIRKTEA